MYRQCFVERMRRLPQQKILIADKSEDFCCLLADILKKRYDTCWCCTGPDVLRLLDSFRPDILILDINMPVIDGISILRDHGIVRPSVIIVLIADGTDFVLSLLTSMNIDHVMLKPCNIRSLLNRIEELRRIRSQVMPLHPAAPSRVIAILQRFGIPPGQNLEYMRTALPHLVCDPLQRLSKELYPAVASIYGCSSWWQVERGIRLAIQEAYERRVPELWDRYFHKQDGCPTNKEFLLTLAELLRQEGEAEISAWRANQP